MEDRFVYADNAATTPIDPRVLEKMMPFLTTEYGNASTLYSLGHASHDAMENARAEVARLMNADPAEIYFTGCGSESDNMALRGWMHSKQAGGKKHLITTAIEHHAILHTAQALEKEGFEVTYLDVDSEGRVSPEDVEKAIRPDTTLVAIMYANNEIGTIMPIPEIAKICHEKGVLCFTDAVQAVGNVPINVHELGVDMLSASGHKLHAPKGIGLLYIRRGVRIPNLIEGGGQEFGKRSGTENVPYIVAFAKALEIATSKIDKLDLVAKKRDRLINEILEKIPYSRLNGPREGRLPGNVNVSFEFIEGESLMLLLNEEGICASTGSACSSRSLEPSHVLLAIGLPHEQAHGSLRLSITHETTDEDIDYILEKLPPVVQRLRDMSPIYNVQV